MDNEKSILEKITDTVKDIATLASDAASHALKSEEPPLKADETAVAYMPLAADGLVSDPLMVAPIAGPPARKKKRAAKRRVVKKAAKKTAKKPRRNRQKGRKIHGQEVKEGSQEDRQEDRQESHEEKARRPKRHAKRNAEGDLPRGVRRYPKLQFIDLRQQKFQQRRRVGLVVADHEIDHRRRALDRAADHGFRQQVLRIERQQRRRRGWTPPAKSPSRYSRRYGRALARGRAA